MQMHVFLRPVEHHRKGRHGPEQGGDRAGQPRTRHAHGMAGRENPMIRTGARRAFRPPPWPTGYIMRMPTTREARKAEPRAALRNMLASAGRHQ